jgi:hypothetical protein
MRQGIAAWDAMQMSGLHRSTTLALCVAVGLTVLISASRSVPEPALAVPSSMLGLSWLEAEHTLYTELQRLAYEACLTGNLAQLIEYSACRRMAQMHDAVRPQAPHRV